MIAIQAPSEICSVVFNYFQAHGLKPARLFCPWNSPGKNTGVGFIPSPGNTKESASNALPSWEDQLEKGMATHYSILAWRIPWTEEPGKL